MTKKIIDSCYSYLDLYFHNSVIWIWIVFGLLSFGLESQKRYTFKGQVVGVRVGFWELFCLGEGKWVNLRRVLPGKNFGGNRKLYITWYANIHITLIFKIDHECYCSKLFEWSFRVIYCKIICCWKFSGVEDILMLTLK